MTYPGILKLMNLGRCHSIRRRIHEKISFQNLSVNKTEVSGRKFYTKSLLDYEPGWNRVTNGEYFEKLSKSRRGDRSLRNGTIRPFFVGRDAFLRRPRKLVLSYSDRILTLCLLNTLKNILYLSARTIEYLKLLRNFLIQFSNSRTRVGTSTEIAILLCLQGVRWNHVETYRFRYKPVGIRKKNVTCGVSWRS